MALGWDNQQNRLLNQTTKHYRFYVDDELENTDFMDKNTFDEFDIMRGKRCTEDALFSKLLGNSENTFRVLKFILYFYLHFCFKLNFEKLNSNLLSFRYYKY